MLLGRLRRQRNRILLVPGPLPRPLVLLDRRFDISYQGPQDRNRCGDDACSWLRRRPNGRFDGNAAQRGGAENQTAQEYHAHDARDAADCAQRHHDADAELGSRVEVAVEQHADRDQHECPVGDDVDRAVEVPREEDEGGRQALLGAEELVGQLGRIAAREDGGEDVEEAVNGRDGEDDVEEETLPGLCEDAEEEKTEGNFERRGREDVEDFAELDKLWPVSWRGKTGVRRRTTRVWWMSLRLKSRCSPPRRVMTMMKLQ
jgi:hypothetical protein